MAHPDKFRIPLPPTGGAHSGRRRPDIDDTQEQLAEMRDMRDELYERANDLIVDEDLWAELCFWTDESYVRGYPGVLYLARQALDKIEAGADPRDAVDDYHEAVAEQYPGAR